MKFREMYFNKNDGGKFISNKLNNGDFDYWLVLEVINMHEATGEEDMPKYNVSILAVSPQQAGKEAVERSLTSCGISDYGKDEVYQVEALSDYGIYAQLWNQSSNNINALLKDARREAQLVNMLFGFYMDQLENRAGSTGWDLIAGNLTFRNR